MKILMTADTVGGVWTYAMELASALARQGHQTALVTMGAPVSEAQQQEADAVPGLTLHESAYKLEWMPEAWEDVARAGDWLLALEAQIRPDVVHLNGYAHGVLPWAVPVVVVGHSCVLSWWEAVKGEPAPPEWERYREEVTRGLRAADMVIAPTQAMLGALERHYGPLPPSRVIRNGRNPALFAPTAKETFIFTAGRVWDEAKNVGTLAQAASGLPWPICVAGDPCGPDGNAANFPNVNMLGLLPPRTLARWLGRAAIYVLPARYEPFGLSALEAALSGCALVLGDIPSLREVWGDAALFVPPNNPAAWHDALCRLIGDEAGRREMAARAFARAHRYTPEQMASRYVTAYQQIRSK